MFETLKKLSNVKVVDTSADIAKVMSSVPVTENISGLLVGDIIDSIGDVAVVIPNIGGVEQRATIVMECVVKATDGSSKKKPIYLSTLIRKHELTHAFTGMIGEDAAFEGSANFDNQAWVDAFKAVTPFAVKAEDVKERPIRTATGTRNIRSRVITLELVDADATPAPAPAPARRARGAQA